MRKRNENLLLLKQRKERDRGWKRPRGLEKKERAQDEVVKTATNQRADYLLPKWAKGSRQLQG
jgi:hypothetical protein